MPALIRLLITQLRSARSLVEILDFFQRDFKLMRFLYPYVAERQDAVISMLLGAWLMMSPTDSGPFSIALFCLGFLHAVGLAGSTMTAPAARMISMPLRRACLFCKVLLWTLFSVSTLIGSASSLGFLMFGYYAISAYCAFQYTGKFPNVVAYLTLIHIKNGFGQMDEDITIITP